LEDIHEFVHHYLPLIQDNSLLLKLSFIDPLRVGSDEIGIACSPAVAARIQSILEGHVSFHTTDYDEIRESDRPLRGIKHIPGS